MLEPQVLKAFKEKLVRQEFKATLVLQAPREFKASKVLQAALDFRAEQEPQAIRVPPDRLVSMVLRAPQVRRAQQE
jgi:hypothetical protein